MRDQWQIDSIHEPNRAFLAVAGFESDDEVKGGEKGATGGPQEQEAAALLGTGKCSSDFQ